MRAMLFEEAGRPLRLADIPIPEPTRTQVLIKVDACGVCRTDLHILEGELTPPKTPLVLGHQIVGTIVENGADATRFKKGEKVGVAWLGKACGRCTFCLSSRENLCNEARYTGFHDDGGFAEYCVAEELFIFPLSDFFADAASSAPFLCGGLIGFRALNFAGDSKKIGFYGFGSSAHLLIQAARFQKREIYVFTRQGDSERQNLAKNLGAMWCGSSEEIPPVKLEAAIIFAPVGDLVTKALKALEKGGSVICAGIHMSDIPSFPYSDLWEERLIRSVANLTRKDGKDFLDLAPKVPIHTTVTKYPLEKVNQALQDLKEGKIKGSAVIVIRPLA